LVQISALQFLIFEFDSKIVDNLLNHAPTELENISSWCGAYKLVFIRRQANNYKVVHILLECAYLMLVPIYTL
jgi:hypothetical protein